MKEKKDYTEDLDHLSATVDSLREQIDEDIMARDRSRRSQIANNEGPMPVTYLPSGNKGQPYFWTLDTFALNMALTRH